MDYEDYFAGRTPLGEDIAQRTLDCLRYRSHGLTFTQIAEATNMHVDTVRRLIGRARIEFQAKNTTHACCIALRLGLID